MKTTYLPLWLIQAVTLNEMQDRQRMLDDARRAGLQVEERESATVRALLYACETEAEEMQLADGRTEAT